MHYDPIKSSLGKVFNKRPFLRKLFYRALDILLLRTWHIKRWLKKLRKSFQSLENPQALDAGAGFGQYTFYLARKFKNMTISAVDIKEEQVKDCNDFFEKVNLKNAKFSLLDLTKLSEKDKYNLILSVDVMEHILEDDQVFKNFHNALQSGGYLLISTPSDLGGSDADEDHDSFIDEHVRDGYNKDAIEQQLKNAGFSEVQSQYSYGFWGHLSWILSMKVPITMLSWTKWLFLFLPFWYSLTFPFALIFNVLDVNFSNKKGTGLIVLAKK